MCTLLNHAGQYTKGTSGAFTFFWSIRTGAECVDYFSGEQSPLSKTIQNISLAAGTALCWPGLLGDVIDAFTERTFSVLCFLAETGADVLEYVNDNALYDLSFHIPGISSVGQVACGLSSLITIQEELNIYFSTTATEVRKNLSFITIAEKVSSLCRAILNLCSIAIGVVVAPQLNLLLTVNWLVLRVTNYFYKNMAVL